MHPSSESNGGAGRQRVALIGPGAIGCCMAAALLERGHELVIGARTRFDELVLDAPDRQRRFAVRCASSPEQLGPVDAVVLATKAHQTADAADWLRVACQGPVPLLVVQNGVDQRERTAAILGGILATPIVPAVVYCPARRSGPGQATLEGNASLIVPADAGGAFFERLFAGSLVRVTQATDWVTAAWGKLLMNSSAGAISALTGRSVDVLADAGAADLARALIEEVILVGRAEGAVFADDMARVIIERTLKMAAGHMPSIAQDRLAGQATEWIVRNEIVERLAARHGIAVPLNRAMTTLLRLGEPRA